MSRAYLRWINNLDREQFDALTDRRVWLFILGTFVAIISIASYAPGARDFFAMRFWPALWSLAPVAICAAIVSAKPLERGMKITHWGILILVTTTAFQFFMWSLVCFSDMPGATVLAALPILLCAYHGEAYRFSKHYPWWALSFVPALGLALLVAPTREHLTTLAVGGLIAFGAAWTMGSHGVLRAASQRERDALKAAVDAQTLLDSVQDAEAKQHLLYELRGANHDAGNALAGVLMNLDQLNELLQQTEFSQQDRDLLREMNGDMRESTQRLRALIERGREAGKQADAREAVNLPEVAQQVLDEARKLHPQLDFALCVSSHCEQRPFLSLHGGTLTFYRVLQNLVKNAIEGNGEQGASRIEVSLDVSAEDACCRVRDNGPGFNPAQLAETSMHLSSTKASGTGLGLYTSQRLVRANHGKVSHANLAEGGAEVRVSFPRAKP